MVLQDSKNGGPRSLSPEPCRRSYGDEPPDSSGADGLCGGDGGCSMPLYKTAPSSPCGSASAFFYSAPSSPVHFLSPSQSPRSGELGYDSDSPDISAGSFEFEFSSRFSPLESAAVGSMSSADELFFNGQIRPMRLASHLQRPQSLAPLSDLEIDDDGEDGDASKHGERGRDLKVHNSRSAHRKTRSLSPMRTADFDDWREEEEDEDEDENEDGDRSVEASDDRASESPDHLEQKPQSNADDPPAAAMESTAATSSASASSSRSPSSSSSSRNCRKWIFLKELLYRSRSEGSANAKDRFWCAVTFSPSKDQRNRLRRPPCLSPSPSLGVSDQGNKDVPPKSPERGADDAGRKEKKGGRKKGIAGKLADGGCGGKRRQAASASAHEVHYASKRAEAEEMKKKTLLPYRQGLFGCLGFSSKSYGAINGFANQLNPVPSK